MKKLFLCLCTVAMTVASGCVLFGDETDDGSVDGDVLVADDGNLTDTLTSLCDATVAANACHNEGSCSDGMHCFAPGEPNCGICEELEAPCGSDDACTTAAPDRICDYPLHNDCYCDWGKACVPPCGVEGGTVCDSQDRPVCEDSRCVAKPCDTDADCLDTFRCVTDDTGIRCQRRTCTADGDCGDCGWCVKGACFDEPGHCDYMVP